LIEGVRGWASKLVKGIDNLRSDKQVSYFGIMCCFFTFAHHTA